MESLGADIFRSIIPEEDFAALDDYLDRLRSSREEVKARRDKMVGTAEEIGQRMKEREARTAASYLASLPKPEIDYTAGIEPDVMNRVDLFLSDLDSSKQKPKDHHGGEDKPATSEPKPSTSGPTIRELTKEEHAQAAAGAKSLGEYLENQQKIRAGTFKFSPTKNTENTENTGPKPIQDNRPGAPAPIPYNDPRYKVPSFSGSQPEKRPIVGPLPDNRVSSGPKPIQDNRPVAPAPGQYDDPRYKVTSSRSTGPKPIQDNRPGAPAPVQYNDSRFKVPSFSGSQPEKRPIVGAAPDNRIVGPLPDNRASSGLKPIQDNRPGVKPPKGYGGAINLPSTFQY